MKRSRSRIAAIAGFVGVFPALVVVALLAFEFSIPIDGLRARVATALSDALGCPLTIVGPLHFITGTRPGIEGGDVRLQECRPIRVARASADKVRVRLSLPALLSREIRLVEIAGERLEVEVPTEAPAPSTTPPGEPSRWTFAEISHLHVAPARVLIRSASTAPRPVELKDVEGRARAGEPMRLMLRGAHGEPWEVTIATATLRDAIAGPVRWPLDLEAAFAGTNGTLHGSWTPAPLGLEADLTLKTAAVERLLKGLGADPPVLGALELTTKVTASADRLDLDAMQFAGPVGAVSGHAHMAMHDRRPSVDVGLSADEIDYAVLARWRSVEVGAAGSLEETATGILARLRDFDGALTASFKQVTNSPFPAADVEYAARLESGRLKVTGSATLDGAPGETSIEIDARGPFAIEAHASVKALPRSAVTQARGVAKLDARIGGLRATLSARGATIAALFDTIHVGVSGRDIRFTAPILGSDDEVRLHTVEITGESQKPLRARAAGTFAGEPLAFELASGPLLNLFQHRTWAIERMRARIGAAALSARGRIEPSHEGSAARFSFDLSVSRLDRLAHLLGNVSLPGVPGSARGSFEFRSEAWRIDATTLAIGATRGSGTVAAKGGTPIDVALDLDRIAVDELAAVKTALRPGSKDDAAPVLADMDLSVRARSADYAGEKFTAIAIDVNARDGVMRAPFSLGWAGAQVAGALDAELGKGPMRMKADAIARGLEVARLPGPLAKQGITGKIGRFAVRVEAGGASLAAITANAAISVEVADAGMNIPKSDALPEGARIDFGGNVRAPAAAPIEFSVKGAYRDKPFTASGQLPKLEALFPEGKPHAVRLVIDYDRSRLEAAGTATIDNEKPDFSGTLKVSGDTLHTLADLAGFSLPPLGPYKVSATVDADAERVTAHDFAMRLGKSDFRASLAAETRKERPRISAKVRGLPVHLEDIGAQAWSPGNVESRAIEDTKRSGKVDEATLDRDARVLTRVLRAFDFDVDAAFDEVSAAGEKIGRADVKARLADGRLVVNPFSLQIDQGKFSAEIEVDARGKVPQYAVKFEGTGFEYGPLMRAADPKSPHHGTLDLSMDIKTSGVPETFKQNATGSLDVLILPKDQSAGSLDLLGAGVLHLLMRTLDPRSQSQLNCIVAGFDLENGIATSQIVLLDTTLARVAGELVIDYRSRGLKGRFAPRSKQPQLFSVAPGITVGGTLDSPDIGVSTQSIVLGALRIWQFPVAFASDWLTNENVPADGTQDCRAAYRHVLH